MKTNKIKGIYNAASQTVRVLKYAEPIEIHHFSNGYSKTYDQRELDKWQQLSSSNIAGEDKDYWQIKVGDYADFSWYCPKCESFISDAAVTNDEKHDNGCDEDVIIKPFIADQSELEFYIDNNKAVIV